jgi:5'-nucleotidase
MADAAGIKVGIIGVMTYGALRATLPLNVRGLRMAPLLETVAGEAARLRAAGARVVILSAHAGGGCDRFDDPVNLSSCDPNSEIFDLARELPKGRSTRSWPGTPMRGWRTSSTAFQSSSPTGVAVRLVESI